MTVFNDKAVENRKAPNPLASLSSLRRRATTVNVSAAHNDANLSQCGENATWH